MLALPYCIPMRHCGVSVNDSDRFCQQCGAPRSPASVPQPPPTSPQYAYAPRQTTPVHDQSQVVAMLPEAKMMTSAGVSDIYTIVFTPNQALFARLTGEILTDAMNKSQAQGKANGKGWLGRANDQMRAKGAAHLRYLDMTPAQILAETPGNFALDHAQVASVGVKIVYEYSNQDVPADPYTEVEFASNGGFLICRLRKPVKEVAETLNNFYPERIKR